ncbi:MATE family efflux transporter [Candidatus Pacebacteria bacterium]|nr:MATE family efflux transporter [Candidatus Paceibacterota bacterium]
MVRRVLNIMYKEVRGLHQAAYVLALFAFGSQLLALVRDRMLAHSFGAGYELDVYYAAFRIPDLLFVLFASTLSVYVLIPFVASARTNGEGDTAARHLLAQVFTLFLIIYTVLAGVIAVFAPTLTGLFFPGLAEDTTLPLMIQILLLQPFFLGISSLFGVVTQLGHRFVLFAISPLIYNLGIIFGIAVLEPIMGLSGLAYGVVLGAIGHMLIQLPLVRNSSLSFSYTFQFDWAKIRSVLTTSVPRAITLSLNQFVLIVFVSMASLMAVGSVSVYQFAYNLQSVPLAIIGASYSVAAFPILAQLAAKKEFDSFQIHITTAMKHIIFWSLPTIALIVVIRAQFVRVILGSGAFDWSDTRLTAAVLALLALSLVAQAVSLLAIRAFYAGGYTRIPFYTSILGAGLAVLAAIGLLELYTNSEQFRYALTSLLRVDDVPGSEVLVLGLGYAIGVTVQGLLLFVLLAQTFTVKLGWLPMHVLRSLAAALLGGAAAYATLNFIVVGINPETFIGIFIQGLFAGIMGVIGIIVGYALLNSPELWEVQQSFKKRLFKTDVVKPQKELL